MCDKMAETDLSIFFIFSFLSLFFGIGRDILSALCCSLFFHSMLSSSIVLVTGASSGIGEACARVFSAAGARCILMARRTERLSELAASLPTPSRVVCCDVRNRTHVHQAISSLEPEWSAIDFLINNAGLSRGLAALQDGNEDDWDEMIDTNVGGLLYVDRAVVPGMVERGGGHVVHIGSLAAKAAARYLGAYPASKFPVAAYSQQLRLELKAEGVHVLLVCPGPIAREDAGQRYAAEAADLPDSAKRPGGGVRIRGLDPLVVSRRILKACESRRPELILPAKARWLLAIAAISPRLGDWIVDRMTR